MQDASGKPLSFHPSGTQMEQMFEFSPHLIYLYSPELKKIVFINKRVTEKLGYTLADIQEMGTSLINLIEHPDKTELVERLKARYEALQAGENAEFSYKIIHKNGGIRTLHNRSMRLLRNSAQDSPLIMSIAEDITENLDREADLLKKQYQLNEAEAIFKCGTWEWQLTNRGLECSEGVFNILGLSSEEYSSKVITRKFYENFIAPEDVKRVINYTIQVLTERRSSYEIDHRLIDAGGTVKYVTLRGQIYYNEQGKLQRIMGMIADRTEIITYQNELERRLTALNKSNRDLEQFAYIASHDLQEPLRKIIAFGERLDKKYKDQLGTEGRFFVDRMTTAAQRMHVLIEDLLTYSRASRQTDVFGAVNLNEVVRNVIEDLEVKIQDKKAVITVADLPSLEAQPVQMHQLFLNLIENALKFTKLNAIPEIAIRVRKIAAYEATAVEQLNPKENYFEFIISDNGIGFEPEYAERIFTIFQRLHGRAEYAGTGLGLAICRKIVETHHGLIEARGELGKGAEFIFYLPVNQPRTL
ncbi:MAG: PAS domain-containing protein [Spirosomataceae bacterium]